MSSEVEIKVSKVTGAGWGWKLGLAAFGGGHEPQRQAGKKKMSTLGRVTWSKPWSQLFTRKCKCQQTLHSTTSSRPNPTVHVGFVSVMISRCLSLGWEAGWRGHGRSPCPPGCQCQGAPPALRSACRAVVRGGWDSLVSFLFSRCSCWIF